MERVINFQLKPAAIFPFRKESGKERDSASFM